MSTILITGGAGFIGSHLAAEMARSGIARVRVLDNLHRGNIERLRAIAGLDVKIGDIRDEADDAPLRTAMQGCDVVFHLAAQSNVIGAAQDSDYSIRTNVLGTYAVLAAARAAGVRRVVFTSSREVYGDPLSVPVREDAPLLPKNLYGASKSAGEAYCLAMRIYGIETVILRLANVYGPGDRDRVIPIFVENALTGAPLVLYGGQQTVDFICIGDVVDALVRAGFGDYIAEPVNIASGTGVTIRELASRIIAVTGSSSAIRVVSPRDIEVGKFIGETGAARRLLAMPQRIDPLFRLADIVESMRQERRESSLPSGATAR